MEHIFKTSENKNAEMFFCLKGHEDFLDTNNRPRVEDPFSPHIAAKSVQNKKPKHFSSVSQYHRYYIKISPNGEVYNPIHYHKISDKKNNVINQVCKTEWLFKEVNKSLFDKYIEFLKTSNLAWLKDIERDTK